MKYQYCSYILFIEFYKTSAMQLARILSRLQPRSKCVSSYLHCASISLILISTFSVNHLQRQQVKSKGNPRTEPNADIKRERSNLVKILQRRWIRCLQQLRKLHYFQWILSLWIITMLYSKNIYTGINTGMWVQNLSAWTIYHISHDDIDAIHLFRTFFAQRSPRPSLGHQRLPLV